MSEERPLYKLELTFSRFSERLDVEDPTLISEKLLDQAWHAMNDIVVDIFDSLGEEPTDELFRQKFIEVCYRLVYREMFTMTVMPGWERNWQERLGTLKRGANVKKKGSYGMGGDI